MKRMFLEQLLDMYTLQLVEYANNNKTDQRLVVNNEKNYQMQVKSPFNGSCLSERINIYIPDSIVIWYTCLSHSHVFTSKDRQTDRPSAVIMLCRRFCTLTF